jgi:copper chaperone CopZ
MERSRASLEIIGLGGGGGGSLAIERELRRIPGVLWAYVNPLTEMAYVEYTPEIVHLPEIARTVEGLGYQAVQQITERH